MIDVQDQGDTQGHHPPERFGQQGVKNFRQVSHVVHCMLYGNNLCAHHYITLYKTCL